MLFDPPIVQLILHSTPDAATEQPVVKDRDAHLVRKAHLLPLRPCFFCPSVFQIGKRRFQTLRMRLPPSNVTGGMRHSSYSLQLVTLVCITSLHGLRLRLLIRLPPLNVQQGWYQISSFLGERNYRQAGSQAATSYMYVRWTHVPAPIKFKRKRSNAHDPGFNNDFHASSLKSRVRGPPLCLCGKVDPFYNHIHVEKECVVGE